MILYILVTIILTLYQKLYINIVSIIVLNNEAKQYNIKINLVISCSPRIAFSLFRYLFNIIKCRFIYVLICYSIESKFFIQWRIFMIKSMKRYFTYKLSKIMLIIYLFN